MHVTYVGDPEAEVMKLPGNIAIKTSTADIEKTLEMNVIE